MYAIKKNQTDQPTKPQKTKMKKKKKKKSIQNTTISPPTTGQREKSQVSGYSMLNWKILVYVNYCSSIAGSFMNQEYRKQVCHISCSSVDL